MADVGLLLNPEQRVFNASGQFDQLATMNFYTSGASSVRQKVYHNEAGTIAQANPVDYSDLSGAGVFYGDPAITYRQVIVNSSGTIISTTDSLQAIMPREQLSTAVDVSTYSIVSDSGINIPLAPSGSGQVVLDGLYIPSQDGTANYVIGTKGNGTLFWAANATIISSDLSPQLGGDLDANSFSIKFDSESGIEDQNGVSALKFTTTASAVNYTNVVNAATTTAPQVKSLGSDSNIDLKVNAKGAGVVKLSGVGYPSADSTTGYTLTTNGSGSVTLQPVRSKLVKTSMTAISTGVGLSGGYNAYADTAPLLSTGTTIADVVFTPVYSTSILKISVIAHLLNTTANSTSYIALFNSASATALAAQAVTDSDDTNSIICLEYFEAAASTSARTYRLKGKIAGATTVSFEPLGITHFSTAEGPSYILIEEFLT